MARYDAETDNAAGGAVSEAVGGVAGAAMSTADAAAGAADRTTGPSSADIGQEIRQLAASAPPALEAAVSVPAGPPTRHRRSQLVESTTPHESATARHVCLLGLA